MNILRYPDQRDYADIMKRPVVAAVDMSTIVDTIFSDVVQYGDEALIRYTKQYDGVALSRILLPAEALEAAADLISNELKEAIRLAADNIRRFHAAQQLVIRKIETTPGVLCWQEARGIERVGIYIPGGTAPLFSTVLMLAIPAVLAGCREIVLCTPPGADGSIHPAICYAASVAGVHKIAAVGGVQAIAALTFGTDSIPAVYKIFGPGNQYVAAAKQKALSLGVAIDLPAGPSELLVVADETAVPAYVAADLLSQAEHGPDSQVICLSDREEVLLRIAEEVDKQCQGLPRKNIVRSALQQSSLVLLSDREAIMDFVNRYAPEHLILCTRDNEYYRGEVINAGSVFLGNYTPESAGDYASGTNHTLPTNGAARAYGGVSLDTFVKKITFQEITPAGLQSIGKTIETMAEAEGLQAHKQAVSIRIADLNNNQA
ncbi:MAG: histidinol dehydrogenase [Sphingobacteriales bacterium]|nr:MAG: histidinol dehydrogenase [Sphingobacteriales bacterium]